MIKKKNRAYVVIISAWACLTVAGSIPAFIYIAKSFDSSSNGVVGIILIVNYVFITYFWLNGTKDIVYTLFFYAGKSKRIQAEREILNTSLPSEMQRAKIVLLYCTCDDFIEESLAASLVQDHPYVRTVILDDSTSVEYRSRVDKFAEQHRVEVVRRPDREGFKAGNLNSYLEGRSDYDFFVILDSDEIIPRDFCTRALRYFANDPNVGLVQASHVSTRNETRFMKRFSVGVDSHWPTYQTVKETYGFLSFLGHGAMISRPCFESVEKFPHVVAEDLCFSLEARERGYYTAFSNLIVCEEQYPVDYFAFKKRHLKWTGGNLEFIRKYSRALFSSRELKWYEKLDVVLFTFNLPLTSVFFLFMTINIVILPVLGYDAGYPLWLMAPTVIYLLSPMINDMVYLRRVLSFPRLMGYLVSSFLLYGSLYWISFYGASKALLGVKAKFIVTPKEGVSYSFWQKVRGTWQEYAFSFFLLGVSLYFTRSFLPVVLIVVPGISAMYLASLARPLTSEAAESERRSPVAG